MIDTPKPRRPKGMGTIKQVAPNQWWGQITLGRKLDGSPNVKSVRGRSEAGVNKQLLDLKAKRDAGADLDAGKMKLSEWLEEWLGYKETMNKNAPRTLESYRAEIRNHINPAIGDVRLDRLNTRHVKQLLTASRNKGLSLRTVEYHRAIIHAALAHAFESDVIPRNPAHFADRPEVPKRRYRTLSAQEAETFLAKNADDRLIAYWTLALACALRQGVLMGLRWQDIDLTKRTLAITGQMQRLDGVVRRVDRETSKLKFATLRLPRFVVEALRQHQERQTFERHGAGGTWRDHDLVFSTPIGTPLDRGNVGKDFHAALERAGLPRIRPHDLRHTASTLLASRGVPPKDIQTLLGHATMSMTDYYTHETDEGRDRVAQAMDDMFGGR
jgi:integrase